MRESPRGDRSARTEVFAERGYTARRSTRSRGARCSRRRSSTNFESKLPCTRAARAHPGRAAGDVRPTSARGLASRIPPRSRLGDLRQQHPYAPRMFFMETTAPAARAITSGSWRSRGSGWERSSPASQAPRRSPARPTRSRWRWPPRCPIRPHGLAIWWADTRVPRNRSSRRDHAVWSASSACARGRAGSRLSALRDRARLDDLERVPGTPLSWLRSSSFPALVRAAGDVPARTVVGDHHP